MKSLFLVIDKRDDKLSTGSVYSAFDALEKSELPYDHSGVIKALREGDASLLTKSLFNDFERVVLPRSAKTEALKREYLDKGALSALMSGAGPSIVGFFDDEKKAKSVSENVYKLL
jgi:4-diphosphocytidyl-2-C-methyl-D-erythritol kinase